MKAPFLPYKDIRAPAEKFLDDFHGNRELPVPIERIVEGMEIDIVPVPGLQSGFDVDAFLSKDLREIRVDEYVYENRESRYRFSLAHEVGHLVLHREIISKVEFHDIASWKSAVFSFPEDQYGYIEFQAHSFAGLVLVPKDELEDAFKDCIEQVPSSIDFDQHFDSIQESVEHSLAQTFKVSSAVIHRRVEYDGLWTQQQ